jgi:hypothetical protein
VNRKQQNTKEQWERKVTRILGINGSNELEGGDRNREAEGEGELEISVSNKGSGGRSSSKAQALAKETTESGA